jgi:ribosomal protein S7
MMHGRNNGKKLMAVRIVAHCFEIVRASAETTTHPSMTRGEIPKGRQIMQY